MRVHAQGLVRKGRPFGNATLWLVAAAVFLIAAVESCTGPQGGPSPANVNKLDASIDGYELKVIDVIRDAPASQGGSLETGNHAVRLTVMFINNSSEFQHAAQFCCKLKDSTGVTHNSDYSAVDCNPWAGMDIGKGATTGPRPICFHAAGDPKAPLTLIWTPSFGKSEVEIPLQ